MNLPKSIATVLALTILGFARPAHAGCYRTCDPDGCNPEDFDCVCWLSCDVPHIGGGGGGGQPQSEKWYFENNCQGQPTPTPATIVIDCTLKAIGIPTPWDEAVATPLVTGVPLGAQVRFTNVNTKIYRKWEMATYRVTIYSANAKPGTYQYLNTGFSVDVLPGETFNYSAGVWRLPGNIPPAFPPDFILLETLPVLLN
jgi:hypothetical protein